MGKANIRIPKKTIISCIICFALGYALCLSVGHSNIGKDFETSMDMLLVEESTADQKHVDDSLDWNIFISAIMTVESNGNPNAIGSADDVGLLQITPIIVEDCNRILGVEAFCLQDRYNAEKSVDMFNIIQEHYNPTRDKHLALKIWNPKSPVSYHRKIMAIYEQSINKEVI